MSDPSGVTNKVWYTVINDLVGGWGISTTDKPMSEHDCRTAGDLLVADGLLEDIAIYVCDLHNSQLDAQRLDSMDFREWNV